jgi:hypothetical protein
MVCYQLHMHTSATAVPGLLPLCSPFCSYGATPVTSSSSHPSISVPPAVVSQCRMELVGSWQCWGVIEDLAVLRGRGSSGQRDSLVLAVR